VSTITPLARSIWPVCGTGRRPTSPRTRLSMLRPPCGFKPNHINCSQNRPRADGDSSISRSESAGAPRLGGDFENVRSILRASGFAISRTYHAARDHSEPRAGPSSSSGRSAGLTSQDACQPQRPDGIQERCCRQLWQATEARSGKSPRAPDHRRLTRRDCTRSPSLGHV
jgi:hypothetical protein